MDFLKCLIFAALFLVAVPLFAANNNSPQHSFGLSSGIKSGTITYQIGGLLTAEGFVGVAHFPLSELAFDTRFTTLDFHYVLDLPKNRSWNFTATTNITQSAGVLTDKDWLEPDRLDIYSESRTDANMLAFSGEYLQSTNTLFFEIFKGRFGLGFDGQYYRYRAFDTVQSYPSSDLASESISGTVLTYEYSHIAFFGSLGAVTEITNRLNFELIIRLSPLLLGRDYDQHLLRDKTSNTSTQGWSLGAAIQSRFRVSKSLSVFGNIHYQRFEAKGEQVQTDNSGIEPEEYTASAKHLGELLNFSAGLSITF